MAKPLEKSIALTQLGRESQTLMKEEHANELIFAVVGHVGSGTTAVAEQLRALFINEQEGKKYDVHILKARAVILNWAKSKSREIPPDAKDDLEVVTKLQDLGDDMRKDTGDNSVVARSLIVEIRKTRARQIGASLDEKPVPPDGQPRVYVLDSIRHPAEVHLLRHVYQDAFVLIGVVCDEDVRRGRITGKYKNAGAENARKFMKRDERAKPKYGQRVSDAFHLADYFVDNTIDRSDVKEWTLPDQLSRLRKIITHSEIMRPDVSETAMHHAQAAAMRSACLSRQVGAALVDDSGNLIASGTNEVPSAGGGVYGRSLIEDDDRCAYSAREGGEFRCSNTTEQNQIIQDLIREIPELSNAQPERKLMLPSNIRDTRIGDLIEFSRAVHAEMDALLSAARTGTSTVRTKLFVTTFPCHYCARHIVAAGVDEVQYIEPYPKSQAIRLHSDSITTSKKDRITPPRAGGKVLFRPFTGVAPRLYKRAFEKDRDLKDGKIGIRQLGNPDWGTAWHLRRVGYTELEALLAKSG